MRSKLPLSLYLIRFGSFQCIKHSFKHQHEKLSSKKNRYKFKKNKKKGCDHFFSHGFDVINPMLTDSGPNLCYIRHMLLLTAEIQISHGSF